MALTKTIYSLMQIHLKFARNTNFSQKVFDELIELSTTADEISVESYFQDGAVTDKTLIPGNIAAAKIKAIFVLFRSVDTANSDAPFDIPLKVNGGSALNIQHLFMHKGDVSGSYLGLSTLTFTQTADIDTEVLVVAIGDK